VNKTNKSEKKKRDGPRKPLKLLQLKRGVAHFKGAWRMRTKSETETERCYIYLCGGIGHCSREWTNGMQSESKKANPNNPKTARNLITDLLCCHGFGASGFIIGLAVVRKM